MVILRRRVSQPLSIVPSRVLGLDRRPLALDAAHVQDPCPPPVLVERDAYELLAALLRDGVVDGAAGLVIVAGRLAARRTIAFRCDVRNAARAGSASTEGGTRAMSFDLGVWYPDRRLTIEEAREFYLRLSEGDVTGVVAHASVDAFYRDLVARHPEIDDIPEERLDDHAFCPWSCAMDRSPGHILLSCVWSQADAVLQLVITLANAHGLVVFDPQADAIDHPPLPKSTAMRGDRPERPWWKFW